MKKNHFKSFILWSIKWIENFLFIYGKITIDSKIENLISKIIE